MKLRPPPPEIITAFYNVGGGLRDSEFGKRQRGLACVVMENSFFSSKITPVLHTMDVTTTLRCVWDRENTLIVFCYSPHALTSYAVGRGRGMCASLWPITFGMRVMPSPLSLSSDSFRTSQTWTKEKEAKWELGGNPQSFTAECRTKHEIPLKVESILGGAFLAGLREGGKCRRQVFFPPVHQLSARTWKGEEMERRRQPVYVCVQRGGGAVIITCVRSLPLKQQNLLLQNS